MRMPPQQARFPDGRLHLHDGPIDLIIEAFGEVRAVEKAYAAAWHRFETILDELCAELPLLRARATPASPRPAGRVARRMADAVAPLCRDRFITPMAAVAGAVAEEILNVIVEAAPLRRAYVNNGGDIALHLRDGESFAVGMIDRPDRPSLIGSARITSEDTVRGVATSGWRGRSFSLGIADAVTVLARSASQADAAATVVANAVDLPGHVAVHRIPASARDPQSDLGDRLVTVAVGDLTPQEIDRSLVAGLEEAEALRLAGVLEAAALQLRDRTLLCGVNGVQDFHGLAAGARAAISLQPRLAAAHNLDTPR
jgi:uncharacterized protein